MDTTHSPIDRSIETHPQFVLSWSRAKFGTWTCSGQRDVYTLPLSNHPLAVVEVRRRDGQFFGRVISNCRRGFQSYAKARRYEAAFAAVEVWNSFGPEDEPPLLPDSKREPDGGETAPAGASAEPGDRT